LFGNAFFDGCKGLFFAQQGRQLVTLSIMSLSHIGAFGRLSDHSILDRHIFLFRLDVVGCKCYT